MSPRGSDVRGGGAQTKATCWDGEFGRPKAANTFCNDELHDYAHSLVDTLDFESLLNILEHHYVLLLNLWRTHKGTFQSGGAIVSDGTEEMLCHVRSTATPQSVLGARDLEPSAPHHPHAGQQCWSAGTASQKLAPGTAATRVAAQEKNQQFMKDLMNIPPAEMRELDPSGRPIPVNISLADHREEDPSNAQVVCVCVCVCVFVCLFVSWHKSAPPKRAPREKSTHLVLLRGLCGSKHLLARQLRSASPPNAATAANGPNCDIFEFSSLV